MEIKLDVTDWNDEYMQEEPNLGDEEQAIKTRIEKQYHPAKAARLYIVAREREQADPEMLPANKLLLMSGGAYSWSQMEAAKRETVKLDNGREISVRSLCHHVRTDEVEQGDEQFDMDAASEEPEEVDSNTAPVYWDDPLAIDRAIGYLMRVVPGYIFGRMEIVAANKGDVMGTWNQFADVMEEKLRMLV